VADRKAPARDSHARYEVSDVSPLLVMLLALGFALSVAGVIVFVGFAFPSANRPYMRGPTMALPQAPRLQSAPVSELERYRAAKAAELNGAANGTVPIDVAMRETARQGWAGK
jgi:hypothetical protein